VTEPAYASRTGNKRIFVPSLPSLEHVLIDATGRQHVVLRTDRASIQLAIEGADLTARPVGITFVVPAFSSIGPAADLLATLHRILSPPRRPAAPRWTARTRKLRDALVALDGREAGASYREVALVLHDADFVDRNWGTGLKDRMRKHLRRGLDLAAGKYRNLLRQPWLFRGGPI
jgi:hypothetical protein